MAESRFRSYTKDLCHLGMKSHALTALKGLPATVLPIMSNSIDGLRVTVRRKLHGAMSSEADSDSRNASKTIGGKDPGSSEDSSSSDDPTVRITDDPTTGISTDYLPPRRAVVANVAEAEVLENTYSNLSADERKRYHAAQAESQRRLRLLGIATDSRHRQLEVLQKIEGRLDEGEGFGDFIVRQLDEPRTGEELRDLRG